MTMPHEAEEMDSHPNFSFIKTAYTAWFYIWKIKGLKMKGGGGGQRRPVCGTHWPPTITHTTGQWWWWRRRRRLDEKWPQMADPPHWGSTTKVRNTNRNSRDREGRKEGLRVDGIGNRTETLNKTDHCRPIDETNSILDRKLKQESAPL